MIIFFLHYSTLKLMSDKFLLWLTKLYFRFIHPCATSSASKKKSDNFFNENMIYCNQLSKTMYWWITLFHHDISIFYRWWCLLTFNSGRVVHMKCKTEKSRTAVSHWTTQPHTGNNARKIILYHVILHHSIYI